MWFGRLQKHCQDRGSGSGSGSVSGRRRPGRILEELLKRGGTIKESGAELVQLLSLLQDGVTVEFVVYTFGRSCGARVLQSDLFICWFEV